MKAILKFNLALIGLFFFGLFLSEFSFPYPLFLAGIPLFFLPGMNLALALEQFTEKNGRTMTLLWTFLFSLLLTPAIIFGFSKNIHILGTESVTLQAFFFSWCFSLTIFLLAYLVKKNRPTILKLPSWQNHESFWIALAISLIILSIHFLLYPFIPEADGYSYIKHIENTMTSGLFSGPDNRYYFYALIWTLSHLSKIPVYWIFKLLLPLFSLILIPLFYSISRQLSGNKIAITIGSLSPFLFPVILQEILVTRPQVIFLLTFPLTTLLLQQSLLGKKGKKMLPIITTLFLNVLGIQIHQLFIFSVFESLLVLLVILWKKYRIKGLLAIACIVTPLAFLSRDIWQATLTQQFNIIKNLPSLKLDLWFLDSYTNTYGEEMGWPGWSALLYYGYNLGLFFPLVVFTTIIKKIKPDLKRYGLLLVMLLIFFFFAEVLPRVGLAHEPNRFWIFISITLAFFLPSIITSLDLKTKSIAFSRFIFILAFLAFLPSLYLTCKKQGSVTREDYAAAMFIKESTPKNAIFLTQMGSGLPINFFAERNTLIPARQFFLEDSPERDRFALENLPKIINYQNELKKQNYTTENDAAFSLVYENESFQFPSKSNPADNAPIFILYANNKFAGIRGTREWWKEANFFGADLSKFTDEKKYKKVYDKDSIVIWKYQPD